MDSKIIDKLKKIKALADKGYKNEALAARKLLYKQLDKYGLTIDDLKELEVQNFEIRYKTNIESKLIVQIAATLDLNTSYYVNRSRLKIKVVCCTPIQYAEICNMFDFYRETWKEEEDKLYNAFLSKHKLFRPKTSETYKKRIGEEPELTASERAKLLQAAMMMEGLSNKKYKRNNQLRLS